MTTTTQAEQTTPPLTGAEIWPNASTGRFAAPIVATATLAVTALGLLCLVFVVGGRDYVELAPAAEATATTETA